MITTYRTRRQLTIHLTIADHDVGENGDLVEMPVLAKTMSVPALSIEDLPFSPQAEVMRLLKEAQLIRPLGTTEEEAAGNETPSLEESDGPDNQVGS